MRGGGAALKDSLWRRSTQKPCVVFVSQAELIPHEHLESEKLENDLTYFFTHSGKQQVSCNWSYKWKKTINIVDGFFSHIYMICCSVLGSVGETKRDIKL